MKDILALLEPSLKELKNVVHIPTQLHIEFLVHSCGFLFISLHVIPVRILWCTVLELSDIFTSVNSNLLLDADKYSWSENYAGSSGLRNPLPQHKLPSLRLSVNVDQLEMDRVDQQLVFCPLLEHPASYIADTVDLTRDSEAR